MNIGNGERLIYNETNEGRSKLHDGKFLRPAEVDGATKKCVSWPAWSQTPWKGSSTT